MKAWRSSLNANAASYVPLCERGSARENKDHLLTSKVPVSIKAPVGFGSQSTDTPLNHQPSKASENYRNHLNPTSHGAYASSSKSPKKVAEKDLFDEDFDMDLAYLQMSFPGYSDECLSHMYLANRGDLECTVDILNQLEFCTGDSGENLPETLEIGDTSESQSFKECTPLKLEEVADDIPDLSGSSVKQPIPN